MSVLFQNYARRPIELVEGKGTIAYDQNGKKYLDFSSGIAVTSLGHANEELVQVVCEQSKKVWHTSNLFQNSKQEEVATKLIEGTHFGQALFCNSGAEANEAAIKLARKHTGKFKIITFQQSFHGRTLGTMAATGQDKVKEGFGPMLETFDIIPYNDEAALERAMGDDVAAIMLEVVQGEGGVEPITASFADKINEMSKQYGALIIVDEVQTGVGRTGTKYAFQQTALRPDIMSLAKGLGGGFPIGAMIATKELADTFGPGTHGTTFGGNYLATAVASKVCDIIFDETFLQQVQEKGAYLKEAIEKELPSLETKGQGLLFGIRQQGWEVANVLAKAEEAGLLTVAAGNNVLRLLPPLTVSKEEIDEAVHILKQIL
ncbi:acetylornithine transaminase [Savagea sp. SN6]|uniref:Acetylornithine aminotransferase n=1 Tax=Savagea serpentis TaxID=2785297 RepID=A0A8J7G7G2_9BACL|nr:acetylornithine transaminase [Savagea serpentis]MBF4501751.1 acetylornithine transaminase [Savagea serpentis]